MLAAPLLAFAICDAYTPGTNEYNTCYSTCMMNMSAPGCNSTPSVGCTSYSDWDNTTCGGAFCTTSSSAYMDAMHCPTQYQQYMCMMSPSSPGCGGSPSVGCTSYSDWDNTTCGGAFCTTSGSAYSDYTHCPTQYCAASVNYMMDYTNCPTQFCMSNPSDSRCTTSACTYADWNSSQCGGSTYCGVHGTSDHTNCPTEYCAASVNYMMDYTNCPTQFCMSNPSDSRCTTSACTYADWNSSQCGGSTYCGVYGTSDYTHCPTEYCAASVNYMMDSTHCPTEYQNYMCIMNPQFSPSCSGYVDLCTSNPASSSSCSGYCSSSAGQMDATNCPTEYHNYLCTMNPQLSSTCSGYVNPCTSNPAFSSSCSGYCATSTGQADASACPTEYHSHLCATDPAASASCPGYCATSTGESDESNCPIEYHNHLCTTNPAASVSCSGYCATSTGQLDETNCPVEYHSHLCATNAAAAPSCSGYCSTTTGAMDPQNCPSEYLNHKCELDHQYSSSCSGYVAVSTCNATDWDASQCGYASYCASPSGSSDVTNCQTQYCASSAGDTDSVNCPARYFSHRCALDHQYSSSCPGYVASACTASDWVVSQCSYNTYCESPTGRDDASNCPAEYLSYRCSIDHQYSSSCSGYIASTCSYADWDSSQCGYAAYCSSPAGNSDYARCPAEACAVDPSASSVCDEYITSSPCSVSSWSPRLCGAPTYCDKHASDDSINCAVASAPVSSCSSPCHWRADVCGANRFCDAYPADPRCIVTSPCTINSWDPIQCDAPTYCAKHFEDDPVNCAVASTSDSSSCSSPCHWRADVCGANKFCDAYPADPRCIVTSPCTINSWDPIQCGAPTYEEAH